jgi:hypothetical protein
MIRPFILALFGVSLLAALPSAASAQIAIEANGARAQQRWGGELGVGYDFGVGPFTLRPIAGVLIHSGDNDRYFEDDLDNGQTRCRDSSNGQFARDDLCDNTALKPYGKVEATVTVPLVAEFGAGARISSDRMRIYGTAAVNLLPKIKLKGNVGDRYVAIGLMANL